MPRPTTKQELISISNENYKNLIDFINSLPQEIKNKNFINNELNERDKTIADVVMHLHEWHNLMKNWYSIGMSGKIPAIPGEGYTWRTLPAFNRIFWEKNKNINLDEGLLKLAKSHKQVIKLVLKHTEDELFSRGFYPWTKKNALSAYFIGSLSSHYDWALKTLKPIKKQKI